MQINYELLGILVAVIIQGLYLAFKIGKFEEKLETLEKKQDKHNSLVERTYHLENCIKVIQEKIKVENHRIENLEENQHECIRKRD